MTQRINNFSTILAAARNDGRLTHEVKDLLAVDLEAPITEVMKRAREGETWVKENFGANAIEWREEITTEDPCSFQLGNGSWTYYAGSYFFSSLDEAVAFRLRFNA